MLLYMFQMLCTASPLLLYNLTQLSYILLIHLERLNCDLPKKEV